MSTLRPKPWTRVDYDQRGYVVLRNEAFAIRVSEDGQRRAARCQGLIQERRALIERLEMLVARQVGLAQRTRQLSKELRELFGLAEIRTPRVRKIPPRRSWASTLNSVRLLNNQSSSWLDRQRLT